MSADLHRIRTGGSEALETLLVADEGALVASRGPDGREIALFVPRTPEDGARERERLDALCGPGIPSARPATVEPLEALVLVGAESARPLALVGALPDGVWRPGLVRLLSALSQAHGRGWTHGRIARAHVLADPSGGFWIWGWGAARPVRDAGPFGIGFDDVRRDLRDAGAALVRHLAGADEEAGDDVAPATLARARDRVAAFDPELARVLARLVTVDPRESYLSATEVLTDLGEQDESLPDPWARLEFVGRRGVLRSILAHAERSGTRGASIAVYSVVGARGTGRTRLLAATAREARARGLVVLQASGSAPEAPWGALTAFARQLLAHLPAGHALRDEPGVRSLLGDAPGAHRRDPDPGSGEGVATALVALVREAFRGTRGLLLLDDEDALPGHVERVWRSLAQQVAAVSGGDDPLRVLLVRSTVAEPSPDAAAPAEVAELGDLSRRQLTAMLAALLTDPGQAPALAVEIGMLVGGRPAEVVEHLRDLVARRELVPVGRRFALGERVTGARGAATDAFRRATETAGREGRLLAEALAVARGLQVPRDALSELTDIPAHRLNAAADAALRSGLVVRDGTTWRVRTEDLRARLEQGLSDDRRRTLHREVLQRLLDAADPDWPAIAAHGRASGDPRAGDWTRRALTVLRAAGRYQEAAQHFDDAAALLPPGTLDATMCLEQADTLLHAGRLDEALRVAGQVYADRTATARQRGEAALALALLHRYDQAWSKALAVELPVDCGDPLILARMRVIRATSLSLAGRDEQAARERRLALSELPSPEQGGSELGYWLLQLDASLALSRREYEVAASFTVLRIRLARTRNDPLQMALELVRLANFRRLQRQCPVARAILRRARAVAAQRLGGNALVETWALSTLHLVGLQDGKNARHTRTLEATAFAAARTGGPTLAFNKQIHLIDTLCKEGQLTPSRYAELRRISEHVDALFPDVVALSIPRLSISLAHCGLHTALERIARVAVERNATDHVRRWSALGLALSALTLDTFPAGYGPASPASADEFVEMESRLAALVRETAYVAPPSGAGGLTQTETAAALLGLCVRRGLFRTPAWPAAWTIDAVLALVDGLDPRLPWAAPLPAALLACARDRLSPEEIDALGRRLSQGARQFPTGLEWLRHLAAANACRAEGRIASALRQTALARLRAQVVDRPESGVCREAAAAAARSCIARHGIDLRPPRTAAAVAPGSPAPPRVGRVAEDWPAWQGALRSVVAARSVLVACPEAHELEVFADVLGRSVATASDVPSPADPAVTLVVAFPERMSPEEGAARRAEARRHRDGGGRVVVLAATPREELRRPERRLAAWLQVCGSVVDLPPALASAEGRRAALAALLRRRTGRAPDADADSLDALADYGWPGGLSELESVVEDLCASGDARVDAAALARIGWSRRIALCSGALHPQEQAVLRFLERRPWSSSSEAAAGLARPSRTVVRILTRMVESGRAVRRGSGRATRYALPDGAGPPPRPADVHR